MNKYIPLEDLLPSIKGMLETPHGKGKILAADLGISPQHLSNVLNGRKIPGPKVLRALGYRRVMVYIQLPDEKD